jgi:hypothetical protein
MNAREPAESPLRELFDVLFASGLSAAQDGTRYYHTNDHYADVASAFQEPDENGNPRLHQALTKRSLANDLPWAEAVTTVAGWGHDLVQWNVEHGVPDEMDSSLEPLLDRRDNKIFLAQLDECNRSAAVDMAVNIFDLNSGDELNVVTGINEFLSAVYVGEKLLETGVEQSNVMAVMALIEATRPLGPEHRVESLITRVREVNTALPEDTRLSENQIEALGYTAAQAANIDVKSFKNRDFTLFDNDTRRLMRESVNEVETPEGLLQAATKQCLFLGKAAECSEPDSALSNGMLSTPPPRLPLSPMLRQW